jgi:outer membrane immunogenic protein
MKNFLASVVSFFALAPIGVACAADMPMKAPAAPPPSGYSWTGCYVGLNGGYGWNSGSTSYRNDPNAPFADPINFVPDPFGVPLQYVQTPSHTGGSGGLAGGGTGCNWQSQQWVVGAEADIDWAHISGTDTRSAFGQFSTGPGGLYTSINNTVTANEQVSVRWLSTIRARVGFAVQDRILLFATGGLAVGSVNTQGSLTTSSPFPGLFNVAWTGSNSAVKTGGVIGGGAEWAIYDHWSAKAEYLWYDLGRVSHSLNCTATNFSPAFCGPVGQYFTTLGNASSTVFGSIVRVGINYKFGP